MNQFARDVDRGLSSSPKFLSSKYFYDEMGDKLFQKIMKLDEYYLTRCEFEIMERFQDRLRKYFSSGAEEFQLIEFGAGDGLKTKILIKHFLEHNLKFKYLPIDISENALNGLMYDLNATFPNLKGSGMKDDYFSALHLLNQLDTRKVILFLGSNIGNFTPSEVSEFLKNMHKELHRGDYLLIGIDLKKDPEAILKAYNDKGGITKEFNLNLLRRINRELGGGFDLKSFEHSPRYDSDRGAALSFLVSTSDQRVWIDTLKKHFDFGKGERIATEISQKYSIKEIENLAQETGFEVAKHFFDSRNYFVDTLWICN